MSDLGSKHECLGCGSKFYDLGRSEIICPKCGADQKVLAQGEEEGEKSTKDSKADAAEAEEDEELEGDEDLEEEGDEYQDEDGDENQDEDQDEDD